MKPSTEADIGPGGEAEWQRLRRQVELADGFWLGFVFSYSPLSSGVLRRRTEKLLFGQTRALRSIRPENPSELSSVLPTLFTPEFSTAGCTWIEALHLDTGNGSTQPWKEAWLQLLSRMNERRDALRRHLHGGLVFIAAPEMKPFIREVASDFWSIRALVVELPLVAETSTREPEFKPEAFSAHQVNKQSAEGGLLTSFTLAESDRLLLKSTEGGASAVNILLSKVDALRSVGRTGEAIEAARLARELTLKDPRSVPLQQAMVLQELALSEKAHGDLSTAEEHLEQAVEFLGDKHGAHRVRLLAELADIASRRGAPFSALSSYTRALHITQQLCTALGETPELLRDKLVSLERIGDVQLELGHISLANAAYMESLALARQLHTPPEDTPGTLQVLGAALTRVGITQVSLGNFSAAGAAYEEALTLTNQRHKTAGDTPEIIRALVSLHLNLGDLHFRLGNTASARDSYETALALIRRRQAPLGDEAKILYILSSTLNRVGSVYLRLNNHSAARTAYNESLAIGRQHRSVMGDTPDILHNLAVTLNRMGNMQRELGNFHDASTYLEEALSLCRQLRDHIGKNPRTNSDLVASLNVVATVRDELGDSDGAASARKEAQSIHDKRKA